MFTKIAPQHARHASGFSVFVSDREHAGYKDESLEAQIDSDFLCGIVPLYVKTLEIKGAEHISHDIVIHRIQEGLLFLGIHTELVYN
jgi:hypothetical protein